MFDELGALIRREQTWLTDRVKALAAAHGFDVEGPELAAGWAAAVCGFLEPFDRATVNPALVNRLDADTDFASHPLTAYGIAAARRHRARGVPLTRFLSLLKYYRRAHVALLDHAGIGGDVRERFHHFIDGVFDIVEIGVVTEWASLDRDARVVELRAANRAAVAERLKYLTVFESVASPILILDGDDRIENANWAAMRTFGTAPPAAAQPGSAYYGSRVPRLVVERIDELLSAAHEARPAVLETVRGERHFRVASRPLPDVTEARAGTVVLLADVSDYVSELAEAHLVNRAKSAFVATMSHELRTPLAGILGAAELLALDQEEHGGANAPTVAAIRSSARVLLNLVDDVLDHARLQAGQVEARAHPVNLRELLDAALGAIRQRAAAKGLRLTTAIEASADCILQMDAAKLQRIVVNLLDNAVKFTDRGVVGLEALVAGGELRIAVSDTGRGFEVAGVQRLFEPFVQDPARGADTLEGTGLGLAICRRLAEVLGGTLDATSAPGAGSRFVLRLPATAAPVEARRPAPATPAVTAGARVLVVEDDEVNRMVTAGLLGHAGIVVTVAATAAEAVRLTEGERFDAVVLDLRLPDGDGVALTRRLRERAPALPIVVLTAYVGEEEEAACRRAGVSAYLRKPTGLSVLVTTLQSLLPMHTVAPPAGGAALDRDRVAGHLAVLGEAALEAIVRAFDRAGDTALGAMRRARTERDLAAVVDALHALRGAAGQLGLDGVAERAAAIELDARAGDLVAVARERESFAGDLRRGRAALVATIDQLVRERGRLAVR